MKRKEIKTKRKGRKKLIGWIIALSILAVLGGGFAIFWSCTMKEHAEAYRVTLEAVDFGKLKDGAWTGDYAGGMYQWRKNRAEVVVSSGQVVKITLLDSADPAKTNMETEKLYGRVIQAQSLQVDTLSGATLTSKAYLKAVEAALLQAQGN